MKAKALYTTDKASYWLVSGEVYRVNEPAQTVRLDSQGFPMGARWESSHDHFERFKAIFGPLREVSHA